MLAKSSPILDLDLAVAGLVTSLLAANVKPP